MPSLSPAERLTLLLEEDRQTAASRETVALEEIMGTLEDPFLLFGAGNLGRKVLKKLNAIGKQPRAFIDNNPALWGTSIAGVSVMSPAEAARQFDPRMLGVLVTIWSGEATDKMSDRIAPLYALGFRKVALFGHLAWRYPAEFLPHYFLDLPSQVLERADEVRAAFALLSDDESRELFVNHVEWRLFLDYDLLPAPTPRTIYFDEHYSSIVPDEVLYDVGAYNGDSAASFLESVRGRSFGHLYCFEPSPTNFAALSRYVSTVGPLANKVSAHEMALGDQPGEILVEDSGGPSVRVGVGSHCVPVSTIDEFSRLHTPPTFIKIDIEGFEPKCLKGAEQVIRTKGPVVAVCVYHLQAHLWEILLQLHSYRPDYRFSLGPHLADGWDLVLYAVPPARTPA